MKNVAILASTYNGGKYLREQLDSIMSQEGIVVDLFVRDDGSSDGTKDILNEYVAKYDNLHVDFAENVGVGNSFMNLLYSSPDTFDYYAFADQDDIWESNKILEAVNMLEESNALLYTSNQECVDKDGQSIGMRYEDQKQIHLTPEAILQNNMVAGCTMVFNNQLFKILTAEEHRPSKELLYNRIHDVWVAFVAALYNGIIYDKRSFIKYRQHECNVVGIKPHKGEKLKKLKNKKLRNGRSLLAKEACEKFPDITLQNNLLQLSAKSKSLKGKIGLVKKASLICNMSGESRLALTIKVICGLY